jgi:hypothetical protein
MAVTQFSELGEGRTKTDKAGSGPGDPPEFRYGRQFLAKTNLKLETEDSVLAAGGIFLGSYHPIYPIARCIGRKASRVPETLYAWHCTYEYTTKWAEIETAEDPVFIRDKVSWSTRFIELPLVVDAETGDAVLNTARDAFDPPVMVEYGLDVVTIEKNYEQFPGFLRDLRNTRNDAEVTIRGQTVVKGEGVIKSTSITDELFHNAQLYFKATLEIILDPLFYNRACLLNDGLNEFYAGDENDKRRILIKGSATERPLPLDVDGAVIDSVDLPSAAVILNFDKFAAASWSSIGIPA